MKDKYKDQFSGSTAQAFQETYPEVYASHGEADIFSPDWIYNNLEKPKDPKMGRFALPVFRHAKLLGDKPQDIAQKISSATSDLLSAQTEQCVEATSAGGFINAAVDFKSLATDTVVKILSSGSHYGDSAIGAGKRQLVEYSAPNIAKPFGIGHLRSTVIGASLRRIYQKLGYEAIGINYPGDWGTQFGKMIVAFRLWGTEADLAEGDVHRLLKLYVRFHEEAEKDEALNDQARVAFAELEAGDPKAVALWERFKEISHAEFDRIYSRLGVDFDLVIGESFFNDKMEAIIKRLERDGLTSISKEALVVVVDDNPEVPPCLLRKADGATLYATRDLAGLIYRWAEYPFEESLYVVGSSQADHFKQCLKVIDLMEEAEKLPDDKRMIGRVKHVDFGWVKFENRVMKTRAGQIILLEDVLDQAVEGVRKKIYEKNPDLPDFESTAEMIGVGAIIFSQLSVKRQRDVNFVWEEVLNFEGETGPYLQYTHARLCSLKRRFESEGQKISSEIDFALLDHDEERRMIEHLADFPQAINDAVRNYDPFLIATYLIRLAGSLNSVYQRKDDQGRIDKILSDNKELSSARMALMDATRIVLKEGLHLLGLQAPLEM